MKFKIPSDYSAPDGVKEGEEFEDIATFKFDGDNMTLIALGQDRVSVYDSKDKKKEKKPKGAIQSIKEQLMDADTETMP